MAPPLALPYPSTIVAHRRLCCLSGIQLTLHFEHILGKISFWVSKSFMRAYYIRDEDCTSSWIKFIKVWFRDFGSFCGSTVMMKRGKLPFQLIQLVMVVAAPIKVANHIFASCPHTSRNILRHKFWCPLFLQHVL